MRPGRCAPLRPPAASNCWLAPRLSVQQCTLMPQPSARRAQPSSAGPQSQLSRCAVPWQPGLASTCQRIQPFRRKPPSSHAASRYSPAVTNSDACPSAPSRGLLLLTFSRLKIFSSATPGLPARIEPSAAGTELSLPSCSLPRWPVPPEKVQHRNCDAAERPPRARTGSRSSARAVTVQVCSSAASRARPCSPAPLFKTFQQHGHNGTRARRLPATAVRGFRLVGEPVCAPLQPSVIPLPRLKFFRNVTELPCLAQGRGSSASRAIRLHAAASLSVAAGAAACAAVAGGAAARAGVFGTGGPGGRGRWRASRRPFGRLACCSRCPVHGP